jgi:hypothetical protein
MVKYFNFSSQLSYHEEGSELGSRNDVPLFLTVRTGLGNSRATTLCI